MLAGYCAFAAGLARLLAVRRTLVVAKSAVAFVALGGVAFLFHGGDATLSAGQFNPTLSIGDVAPTWSDLPGVDGKPHGSNELADKQAVIVVFTCNSCPTAVDYEDRLIALTGRLAADGKCAVVAVSSNRVAEDQLPKMQERAEAKKFNFQYLRDESQELAKAFGASYTPEFFVLDKQRRVVYMGAMDDNTEAAAAKIHYVEAAVLATLAGKKPAVAETAARGCAVRFVRDRKKK